MKIYWKTLALCIAVPLVVGGISGFLTKNSMSAFAMLNKPPLSPPGWIFPVVWSILYTLMGIASYLVLTSKADGAAIKNAMSLYGIQLAFNFLWSIIFFNFKAYFFAFGWLVVLWLLILATTRAFYPITRSGAYMLVPYLIWVAFAGYLNLGIALLN